MKKWLWISIAILAVGVSAYLALNWSRFFGTSYPESIFPREAVIYLSFHDITDAKKNLDQTIFWQKSKTSPRKGTYQKQLDRFLTLIESGTGINPKPLLEQFSKDVALGIFPIKEGKHGGAFEAYINEEEKVKDFFTTRVAASLRRRFPDSRRTEQDHNGVTYFTFSGSAFPKNASPSYCFLDHRIILSESEEGLKRILDVRDKKVPSLKENSSFLLVKKEIKYERGLLFYLNTQGMLKMVQNAGSPALGSIWPGLVRISGANGLDAFGYRLSVEQEGFGEAGYVSVKAAQQGLLKSYMDQSPAHLESIQSVPAGSRFVTAGTLSDFARIFKETNGRMSEVLNADQMDKWNKLQQFMKAVLNFDVQKDLLAPIGNEFCFAYIPAPEREMNPGKMKYYAAVQLEDPEKFRELVQRVEALQWIKSIEKQQQTYNGRKIEVFHLKEGSLDISPSYCFDGKWFYAASGPDFMKQAFDAQEKKTGIQSDADYKKVTAGFPSQLNGISYTNVPAYLRMYSAILKKDGGASSWLHGYGLDEEMEYLSPYLFGAATYTLIRKDGIYFRSYASIPSTLLSFFPILNSLPKYIDSRTW